MMTNYVQVEGSEGAEFQPDFAFTESSGCSCITKGEDTMQGFFSRYSWAVFPVCIFWLLGIVLGIYGSKIYFKHKLEDAVKMNRIMIQSVVYDLMPYDRTGK